VPPGFAFAGWINFRGPIIEVEAELYAFRRLELRNKLYGHVELLSFRQARY